MRRLTVGIAAVSVLSLGVLAPAQAQDSANVQTWAQAATFLGSSGSLWEPKYTVKKKLNGGISVIKDTFPGDGSAAMPPQFATSAGALYGSNKSGFRIMEKYADSEWAADPAPSWQQAPVGSGQVKIKLGDPGTQISINATVSANCYQPKFKVNIPEQPKGFKCSQADVKKYGGVLEMTAKPPSTMTAPGNTTIRIESNGLTYQQLLTIARNLQQVMG